MSNFIICGMPGSGKSTLGKKLAKQLERTFIDTDQLIEKIHKKSCSDLYLEKGEQFFRKSEKELLKTLQNTKNTIIALGGGTLDLPENQTLVKKIGILIYLKCDPLLLKKRRVPSYITSPSEYQELIDRRLPIFESLQDYTLLSEVEYGK